MRLKAHRASFSRDVRATSTLRAAADVESPARDRHVLDRDRRDRLLAVQRHRGDVVDGLLRRALAEDRVVPVEVRGRRVGDEELLAVRVVPAVRHAEEPGAIVLRARPDLVLDHVAGLARAVADRVAPLDHEALDDAVERRPVVRGALHPVALRALPRANAAREADEVGDRVRGLVVVELARQSEPLLVSIVAVSGPVPLRPSLRRRG